MNVYLLNTLLVVIALLTGVATGLAACWLARSSGATWAAAFCFGVASFAGTVLFVLTVKDHVLAS
ncbi:hypothetical protein [Micromonospora aurantiaca (nom. illeg.)]|uniref:hypothetical protein n=1 Tax=Micromonospora aurantiaca (nom. illeg.) TaxID=47850 RepID=UPI00364828C4